MQILELYKRYIDPEHTWETFTLEEQAKVVKAPRSNALLDTSKVATSLKHSACDFVPLARVRVRKCPAIEGVAHQVCLRACCISGT